MAISGIVGQGVVKIALSGFQALSAQLASVRAAVTNTVTAATKAFGSLNQSVNSLGSMFATASGAVRSFASVADPRGALELELAFLRLQIAIGRFFVPILREAGKQVNALARYLNSLSDGTREQVLSWTKLGLSITGVAAGFGVITSLVGRVVAIVRPLVSGLSAVAGVLWRVLGFLGPWGRLAVIIGSVAAAAVGLSEAGGTLSGVMAKVTQYANTAWATLQKVWAQLSSSFAPVVAQAEGLLSGLVDFVTSSLGGLGPVLTAYAKVWGEVFSRTFALIGKAVAALAPYLGELGAALAQVFNGESGEGLAKIFQGWASAVEAVLPVVTQFFDLIDKGLSGEAFAGLADDLRPALALFSQIGESARTVFTALRNLGASAFAAISTQVERLQPSFDKLSSIVRTVFDFLATSGAKVADVLGGIAERVGPPLMTVFERLGVLFERLYALATAVVSAVGNGLAYAIGALATTLGPAFAVIGDVFERVVDRLTEGFNSFFGRVLEGVGLVARWFQWLADRIETYFAIAINKVLDVINGMIGGVNKLIEVVEHLNPGNPIGKIGEFGAGLQLKTQEQRDSEQADLAKRINGALGAARDHQQQQQPQQKPQPAAQPALPPSPLLSGLFDAVKAATERKPGGNTFNGELLGNARFIGISEAMRAAQQSTVPTRESVAIEEILRNSTRQTQIQEAIRDNTGKAPNMGLAR